LESTDNLAEISGLRFNQPYFAVLLFLIDDYQRFSKANSKAMQDLFKFAVINITEELAAEFGSGYGIDLLNERGIAIILNLSKDNETDLLMDLGMRSKDFFSQNFRFTLTVGIGSLYEDSGMIKQSFAEASRAAYYRMILGGDRVIFYTELSGIDSRVKYNYPTELEMGLILAIKHGRMNEMEQIVNTIMESMVSQEIAPENVQFICSGIINAILKTIKDIGLEFHSEQDKELVELFTQDFETIAIFEARIIEISRKVGRYIQNSRESKNFILRDRILKYVTEHYTDSNLSLNSIAEQFEVTPSYLTRYFKDQTGYPLMQYLDSVRMGKAKELLKSSDLKSKEIMIRSGYVDENNFIRKFKKGEGLTPIQYRNLTKNGKKEED
jgi:AraC-like DNA-binding protein